jgi:hypothetical protein
LSKNRNHDPKILLKVKIKTLLLTTAQNDAGSTTTRTCIRCSSSADSTGLLARNLPPGEDFSYIFSAENHFPRKIPRKIFPQKCWKKIEFSAEKFLTNHFSKKFRGIFRGKKSTKNRPLAKKREYEDQQRQGSI